MSSIEFKEDFLSEEKVRDYLKSTFASIDNTERQNKKIIIRSLNIRWWAVAASVLLILSVGYLFLVKQNKQQIAKIATQEKPIHDIAPGGNRATLTLGNGNTINLDSAQNGSLAIQGNTQVVKLNDGQLAYQNENNSSATVQYNTITTPRGGQYQLTLADGSQVWLNAASSITFPTSFVGDTREVKITGEAYFEVAHNANMPFHVKVGNITVQVLGTHFNINAYEDEGVIKTTLLEGSVKVSEGKENVMIEPGEQAQIKNPSDKIIVKKDVDMEEVVAWKNGLFQFDNTNIQDIMRKISRWYDVEVVFEGDIPNTRFNGKIYRNVNASMVFKILEEGGIHIIFKEGKVIVTN
ncbi:MAG: FecR domain-containing protein [Ginsengibacter sp.]